MDENVTIEMHLRAMYHFCCSISKSAVISYPFTILLLLCKEFCTYFSQLIYALNIQSIRFTD